MYEKDSGMSYNEDDQCIVLLVSDDFDNLFPVENVLFLPILTKKLLDFHCINLMKYDIKEIVVLAKDDDSFDFICEQMDKYLKNVNKTIVTGSSVGDCLRRVDEYFEDDYFLYVDCFNITTLDYNLLLKQTNNNKNNVCNLILTEIMVDHKNIRNVMGINGNKEIVYIERNTKEKDIVLDSFLPAIKLNNVFFHTNLQFSGIAYLKKEMIALFTEHFEINNILEMIEKILFLNIYNYAFGSNVFKYKKETNTKLGWYDLNESQIILLNSFKENIYHIYNKESNSNTTISYRATEIENVFSERNNKEQQINTNTCTELYNIHTYSSNSSTMNDFQGVDKGTKIYSNQEYIKSNDKQATLSNVYEMRESHQFEINTISHVLNSNSIQKAFKSNKEISKDFGNESNGIINIMKKESFICPNYTLEERMERLLTENKSFFCIYIQSTKDYYDLSLELLNNNFLRDKFNIHLKNSKQANFTESFIDENVIVDKAIKIEQSFIYHNSLIKGNLKKCIVMEDYVVESNLENMLAKGKETIEISEQVDSDEYENFPGLEKSAETFFEDLYNFLEYTLDEFLQNKVEIDFVLQQVSLMKIVWNASCNDVVETFGSFIGNFIEEDDHENQTIEISTYFPLLTGQTNDVEVQKTLLIIINDSLNINNDDLKNDIIFKIVFLLLEEGLVSRDAIKRSHIFENYPFDDI